MKYKQAHLQGAGGLLARSRRLRSVDNVIRQKHFCRPPKNYLTGGRKSFDGRRVPVVLLGGCHPLVECVLVLGYVEQQGAVLLPIKQGIVTLAEAVQIALGRPVLQVAMAAKSP